ncbi:MAG: hypothetical protein Tsb0013_08960 [Phycisphaerales bacterium]
MRTSIALPVLSLALVAAPASAQLQIIVDRELDLIAISGITTGAADLSPSVPDVSWIGSNPGGIFALDELDLSAAATVSGLTADLRLVFPQNNTVRLEVFQLVPLSTVGIVGTLNPVSYAGESDFLRAAIEGSVGATLNLSTGSGFQPVNIVSDSDVTGLPDSYILELLVSVRSLNVGASDTHELIVEPVLFERVPSAIPGVTTLRTLPSDATVRLTTPTGNRTFDNIGLPERIITTNYTDFFSAFTGVWTLEIEEPGMAPDVYEIGTGFAWDTTQPYRFVSSQQQGGALLTPIDLTRSIPDASLPSGERMNVQIRELGGAFVRSASLNVNETSWSPSLTGITPDEYRLLFVTSAQNVPPPFTVSGVNSLTSGNRPLTASVDLQEVFARFERNVLINFPSLCQADFDNDYDVDLGDFGVLGTAFGTTVGQPGYNPDADFDNDGDVDLGDFGVFGNEFGRGPADCAP